MIAAPPETGDRGYNLLSRGANMLEQPRVAASRLSRFRHYTNLGKCEDRLRRLLGEFRFGPAKDSLTQLGLLQ